MKRHGVTNKNDLVPKIMPAATGIIMGMIPRPEKMTREQSETIWNEGKCPDCRGDLLAGPRGGLSINARCDTCGHEFNVPPPNTFMVERI